MYMIAREMKVDDIFFLEEREWLEAIERILQKNRLKSNCKESSKKVSYDDIINKFF